MTEIGERVHQRVWDLLPWYANGTLAAGEREMVDNHLAGCPHCRHEVESSLRMQLALHQLEEAIPSPHPVQLARLMARLDEPAAAGDAAAPEGVAAAAASPAAGAAPAAFAAAPAAGERRWLPRLLATTPQPVRWALAAQLVMLLSLAAMQAPRLASTLARVRTVRPAPQFHTLSQAAVPARGPEIRIVFSEAATERQIRELLLRIGGHLADGPSPLGTYVVQISGGTAGTAATAATPANDAIDYVLAYLRSQPMVRFAQPVAGSMGGTNP